MKKAIIAGAASAVLASMPVVGVFATGTVEDTIKVGIDETCAIAMISTNPHANGQAADSGTSTSAGGTWGNGAEANILSGTVANGTKVDNYGSTTMTITCNHSTGYVVSAVATDLTASTAEATAGTKATIPLNASFAANDSGWAYKMTAKATGMTSSAFETWTDTANNTSFATGTAPVSDGEFTVQYGVSVDEEQPADANYTGTITYTINAAS